jgi:hypothetical protein
VDGKKPIGQLFRNASRERGEWPDIDLDLPSGDEREKVIQHVYERYGKWGAAMTANVCNPGESIVVPLGPNLFRAGRIATWCPTATNPRITAAN